MAMMSLGVFVFMQTTIPYQSTTIESSYGYAVNKAVGRLPQVQFVGKESESITINGTLMPEITGGEVSIAPLLAMAEKGKPYPLIEGSVFMVKGFFVIEKISQTHSELFANGRARKIDFSMTLKRVDEEVI